MNSFLDLLYNKLICMDNVQKFFHCLLECFIKHAYAGKYNIRQKNESKWMRRDDIITTSNKITTIS